MGGLVFWRTALIHHGQLPPAKVDSLIEQWRQEGYPDGFLGWFALRKRVVAASMVQIMLENLFAERQESTQRHQRGANAAGGPSGETQVTRSGIKRRETEARLRARAESRNVMEQKMRESGVQPGVDDPDAGPAETDTTAASLTSTHIPRPNEISGRRSLPASARGQGTPMVPLPSPRFSKTMVQNREAEADRNAAVPRPSFQTGVADASAPPGASAPAAVNDLPDTAAAGVSQANAAGVVPRAKTPAGGTPAGSLAAVLPSSTTADTVLDPSERPKTGANLPRAASDSHPVLVPMAGGVRAPKVGTQFGAILLTRILGQGGAGIVYHGWNLVKEMPCAVKLLLRNLENEAKEEMNMTAFRREAEITARLSHPNIVCVLNFGEEYNFPFMELEYIDGLSAAELLRYAGRVTPSRAIKIVMAVCEGLDHALANGIVHRDVKPGNFLLDRSGQVKISDFGLAYTYVPQTSGVLGGKNIMGTPTYMAPEQSIPGSVVDYRADIYALGITLYHLIAGVPPFPGRDPAEIIFAHRNQPPPPLSQYVANLPGGLWAIISRMIEKSPNDRPDSYTEILQGLAAF
ncbi:MAG: protein kinase domain-containing protein [Planctomycetota bacterium]